jgi:filamentous hemagglutinin family protein
VSPDRVINTLPSNQIDGGAQRGANLFHSFREFNINVGRGVYFSNPAGVANIFTRVTGVNPSQILGTLGVLGNANLFLINPNGILFGPNAQLGIGGSFIASTANSLVFNNGFAFSATDSQAPPLLTVNVPIGLQYGSNPGAIRSQEARLQMPNGQTLTLAGGTVTVDGGQLRAPGGRVELAGVAAAGEVGLTQQGQEWRLSVPEGLGRADVAIANDAIVNVRAGGGGSIAITARNLTLTGFGTELRAGIAAGSGTIGAQAGDIDISTTKAININESLVANEVQQGSTGNGGDIRIITGLLSLSKGAQVNTPTSGDGDAGNITITARDAVFIDGMTSDKLFSSGVVSTVSGRGQGGDISITTGTLSLTGGALVDATTLGQGDAGNITIAARDTVFFAGVANRFPGGVVSRVLPTAMGQGGDINITTGTLDLIKGAALSVTTFGKGNAGNITITARDAVSFDGVSSNGLSSGAFSAVETGATGKGGEINITTDKLTLTNGAAVNAPTFGEGNAGNIIITARDAVSFEGVGSNGSPSGALSAVGEGGRGQGGDIRVATGTLSLTNGAKLTSSTFAQGAGDAGNIIITARDQVFFDGVNSTGLISGAFSSVRPGGIGQGGDITITAAMFSLRNGAAVNAAIGGKGTAGNITIMTRDAVSFDGVGNNGFPTGAFSTVNFGGMGQGGDIRIATGKLSLTNGAAVNAATFGEGNAGNITIAARDEVAFDGVGSTGVSSAALSSVGSGSAGQGGTIRVNTGLFSITNGGILSASSDGQGNADNLDVTARQLRLDNQGSIQAQTASGQGGNITLQVPDLLLLRRGSSISTTAGTAQAEGDGGNITFNGNFIVAVPTENSDISANAFTGKGGRVEITAQNIFGIQARPRLTPLSDITASSDTGIAGVVAINTPNLDPNNGLLQLPVDMTDVSRLIVQTCPTGDSLAKPPNQFIITGRGGLPPTPSAAVDRDAIQVDLVTADVTDQPASSPRESNQNPSSATPPDAPIVEAQGWIVGPDGTVYLVAAAPTNGITHFLDRPTHCH